MSGASNFNFLAAHDQRLSALGSFAERYFRDDPSTTIVKLRQFAELTAKIIAARHATYRDPREPFEETLRRLSYEQIIPKEVADIFHALRKIGNTAVHEAQGNHADALTSLKFARSLGIWFHRTYGKQPSFSPGPFVPPPEPVDATALIRQEMEALRAKALQSEDAVAAARREAEEQARARETAEKSLRREAEERAVWEQLAQETEAAMAAIAAKLAALQADAEAAPRDAIMKFVVRGEEAAAKLELDEGETRALVDQQLRDRGWEADTKSLRHGMGVRPAKARNMAIAEWPTASGPADYALFVGTVLIGIVEAKRKRKNVSAAIDQSERYSVGVGDSTDFVTAGGPWGEHRVPFVFAANGRPYLKQIETESGIWFRDTRRSANHRRALVDWPTPDGLSGLLEVNQDAANAALKAQPFEFGFPLRRYQEAAIRAVEDALSAEQRSMLVAMATGTGKTKLAIALLYRLLSAKRFRRICFVVDRSALGHQTEGEFSTTKVVSGKTFAEIFGLKGLEDVTPDLETKVHICTIQGLVKRVLYAADTSEAPPVDQYDLMVIDECHRGYLLDREMSDAELSFRGQEDYISKYRRVLDYFDAVKIGLTATPALHTTDIFGEPIFRYSYREAVIDGFLTDHEPPIRIETALAQGGIGFSAGEQVEYLAPSTGEIDTAILPDEIRFEVEQFNKQVITPEFNRVVTEQLAKHIDPALPGKTLIFAATDAHADIVVSAIKKAFAEAYGDIDDTAVKKITGSVDKVQNLIRSFRNDANPKIAVTVDLLTTGIDVPKIVDLVFLRRVNSRILYEQMIGRATRQCPEIGKEVFRIFDAVDLYPHLQDLTDMKPVVVNPLINFEQLVGELIGAADHAHRETIREQLAVKLRRRLKRLPEEARQRFEAVAGETPEAMLQRLLAGDGPALAAWLKDRAALGPILDWQSDGENPRYIPISHHADEIVAVTRGYGEAEKPQDFLDSLSAFVRDNINTIAALKLVVQRPRDLTRSDLKELRLALDRKGYSEANLRRAWADAKNEEIAASIIGFVRQAAIGDPLMPYTDRVKAAMRNIVTSRQWTEPQKRWLKRIGEQVEKEIVVDREAIDREPFIADGGYNRLNKVFGGGLENILSEINDGIWRAAS
ncbi:type I restriction-modification system endonuclease [Mesorhizobium sp.]|uniref:type I restriction-modification system endonuclease n=1 Tax=Mesorhizobium sp. TaxID=1871066 RepID=UPI000FE8B36C|nr:type I restriction-modification system endonuclease [Mesorhizobium sp.]RWK41710.1 MAG: type I restriction-modification system endonuclease [Mesorhizobium sp.]RWK71071.1 MAG: type I restriction-modification system endonuclease [Mesorhizobium sp.]RWK76077.1 MAG: type I restriction-modification system endonuclease [Mesorhizobium sp.]RWK84447.1 MAG: type I restriction-modification system endonuclease [Mesorhizobium sp.]RWL05058.1 MAG: type I restriction-modification system endonuclease [Mesorhi